MKDIIKEFGIGVKQAYGLAAHIITRVKKLSAKALGASIEGAKELVQIAVDSFYPKRRETVRIRSNNGTTPSGPK